jgi:hypothetical protein
MLFSNSAIRLAISVAVVGLLEASCTSVEYRNSGRLDVLRRTSGRLHLSATDVLQIEKLVAKDGDVKITSVEIVADHRLEVRAEAFPDGHPVYEDVFVRKDGSWAIDLDASTVILAPLGLD